MDLFMKDYKDRTDFYELQKSWFDHVDVSVVAKDGYVPMDIIAGKPELKEGELLGYHFTLEDGRYKRVYLAMTAEDPRLAIVHSYRIGDLFWWVAQKGLADQLDALLKSQGIYTAAITQTVVSDDDPNFTTILASVQRELKLTDEQVAEALASARIGD